MLITNPNPRRFVATTFGRRGGRLVVRYHPRAEEEFHPAAIQRRRESLVVVDFVVVVFFFVRGVDYPALVLLVSPLLLLLTYHTYLLRCTYQSGQFGISWYQLVSAGISWYQLVSVGISWYQLRLINLKRDIECFGGSV
jgi:hypothetical protein